MGKFRQTNKMIAALVDAEVKDYAARLAKSEYAYEEFDPNSVAEQAREEIRMKYEKLAALASGEAARKSLDETGDSLVTKDELATLGSIAERFAELLAMEGGCDHAVGICVCGDVAILGEAREILARLGWRIEDSASKRDPERPAGLG